MLRRSCEALRSITSVTSPPREQEWVGNGVGTDDIVGIAKVWAKVLSAEQIKMILSDGTVLKGKRHRTFSRKQARKLKARLIDLEKAYKQVARDPKHEHLAIFGVFSSADNAWSFFEALALGFGPRNAVLGFNLFARALRFIDVRVMGPNVPFL